MNQNEHAVGITVHVHMVVTLTEAKVLVQEAKSRCPEECSHVRKADRESVGDPNFCAWEKIA